MQKKQLSKDDLETIHGQAEEKLQEFGKKDDVIGSGIFAILEKSSKVLYYPLEDQKVWGFSDLVKGKSFVCINTSLPYDRQVFTAAHELYHVWFCDAGEVMLSEDSQDPDSDDEVELRANRFAAEFLVDEQLLRKQMKVFALNQENLDIKGIVRLATMFTVPYRTMVRRLKEIGVLSDAEYKKYHEYTDNHAAIWRKRLGLSMPKRENKIGLSTLVDQAMDLYERNLITYEKLEYLLGLAELRPESMGIIGGMS